MEATQQIGSRMVLHRYTMALMSVWILVATVAGHVAVVHIQAPQNSTETGEGAAMRTLQHPRTPVHVAVHGTFPGPLHQ